MIPSIVDIRHISVQYGSTLALNSVNLSIKHGDYTCVLGHNGSGKSTLAKALLGLVPLSEGDIHYHIHRSKVGYLSQELSYLPNMNASVWEVVMSGLQTSQRWCCRYTQADKLQALEALDRLDIAALAKCQVDHLSGGQKRRVFLARALIRQPQLLVLDEPTAGFDSQSTQELYHLLGQLNSEGLTILMISHDHEAVKMYANTVVFLNKSIIFHGSKNEWLQHKVKVFSCS